MLDGLRRRRLQASWDDARDASCPPAEALERLRAVRDAMRANPDEWHAHAGAVAADLLRPALVGLLTEDDFSAIEDLARVSLEHGDGPVDALDRLVAGARTARGEQRAAQDALLAMHDRGAATPDARRWAALELARLGADGDGAARVFARQVREARYAPDPLIVAAVERALDVDPDSDSARRDRAHAVVVELGHAATTLARAQRASGIRALVDLDDPRAAVAALTLAVHLDPGDATSRATLAGALLASGLAGRALAELDAAGADRWHLRPLGEAMRWLDEVGLDAPPPSPTAADLLALDVPAWLRDARDGAAGRRALVEGRARLAEELLTPLARRRPDDARWSYHAAWAQLLVNGTLAVDVPVAPQATWPLASLLGHTPAAVPAAVEQAGIAAARQALGDGRVPDRARWQVGGASAEDDLEAARVTIAIGLARGELEAAGAVLASAPFARLPACDQLHWRGLLALAEGAVTRALGDLRDAVAHGSPLAEVALCAALLEHGPVEEAQALLDGPLAQRLGDPHVALLDAHACARAGHLDAAAQRLASLHARGVARAAYALADVHAGQALAAAAAGEPETAAERWGEAASAARAALAGARDGSQSLPADARTLHAALTLAAEPVKRHAELLRLAALTVAAEPVKRHAELLLLAAGDGARRPWLAWHGAVAELWTSPPAAALAAADELVRLIETAAPAHDGAAAIAIAGQAASIATTCRSQGDRQLADRGLELLDRLVACGPAALRTIRRTAAGDGADDGDLDALVAARAALAAGDHPRAARLLAEPRDAGDPAGLARAMLHAALTGAAPPAVEAGASPALTALEALAAFAAGNPEHGSRAVLRALDEDAGLVERTVALEVLLGPICCLVRARTPPPRLLAAVQRLARHTADPAAAAAAARCAAKLGASDIALEAWSQAERLNGTSADIRREHAAYACHLAVLDAKRGDESAAADWLDLAAGVTAGGAS